MVRRTITLGERSFEIGPMTLGTVRRVPEAFKIAANIDLAKPTMPTSEQFDAMVSVLWDGINAATPGAIARADFESLVNDLDFVEGITQIADAIKTMTTMKKKPADGNTSAVGNSASSESKS